MKWPAQNPDLNHIENLWKITGDKVMAKKPPAVTELWNRLKEEWNKIKPEQCEKSGDGADVLNSFKSRASPLPTIF